LLNIFNERLKQAFHYQPKPFKVFIGHGGRNDWKDLRDHLRDVHKYDCVYFESDERAGRGTTSVISQMLEEASFALLVLTAEDECKGAMRGRQNVVHEAGLFQAKLGFEKAIVLKEEGVEQFSNIVGIAWVPFRKNSISDAFGHVLGVIRQQFPNLNRANEDF
jgi:predicted nucleotide-binding protein